VIRYPVVLGGEVLAEWQEGLDDLFAVVAGRFSRVEPRRLAFAYVRGMLAPLERRNGWTIAEHAGRRSPNAVQEMLYSPCWDPDLVRDDVRDYLVGHLGEPSGVLIADDTGFIKKGVRSAGVQRQYTGTAGKVENCQIGTFLAYATQKGRGLIDRELYLPRSWTADRDRCARAAVPEEVGFVTKPAQARMMIERAIAAGVPFEWFTADEAFGQNPGLRDWLQQQDIAYGMATLWAIEESFQTAKNEVGMDQYQVRRYDAWYAHITLAMTAAAFLVVTRAIEAAKGEPVTATAS
jgi:SRSO17 transposase